MITNEMLDAMWCPICQDGTLSGQFDDAAEFTTGTLKCTACDATYPVREGIPDLIPHGRLKTRDWDKWTKHLDRFYQRRAGRAGDRPTQSQSCRWGEKAQAFADFIDLPNGLTLDVGCGPGKLRFPLKASDETYFGVDPLPVPEVDDFPYARALAEYIPFKNNTFSAMIVRSALDHFCDLDIFFAEAVRVLKPGGRIYIEQVVMRRSPLALCKSMAHSVNDFIDDMKTTAQNSSAPKHMHEFSTSRLMKTASEYFAVSDVRHYNRNWYTPTQMFVAFRKHH